MGHTKATLAATKASVEARRGKPIPVSVREKIRMTHRNRVPNGECSICRRVAILDQDHDHATGIIRNKLCQECNTGLGKFKDSPELLREAALYLEKWRITSAKCCH